MLDVGDDTDNAIVGAGAAMFVVAFVPWFDIGFSPRSSFVVSSASGWDAGAPAVLAILLSLVAGSWVELKQRITKREPSDLDRILILTLAGASALLVLFLAAKPPGLSINRRYGLFLALLAAMTQVGFAVFKFMQASGAGSATTAAAMPEWQRAQPVTPQVAWSSDMPASAPMPEPAAAEPPPDFLTPPAPPPYTPPVFRQNQPAAGPTPPVAPEGPTTSS